MISCRFNCNLRIRSICIKILWLLKGFTSIEMEDLGYDFTFVSHLAFRNVAQLENDVEWECVIFFGGHDFDCFVQFPDWFSKSRVEPVFDGVLAPLLIFYIHSWVVGGQKCPFISMFLMQFDKFFFIIKKPICLRVLFVGFWIMSKNKKIMY